MHPRDGNEPVPSFPPTDVTTIALLLATREYKAKYRYALVQSIFIPTTE